jgi:lysine 2,3-aminomutase
MTPIKHRLDAMINYLEDHTEVRDVLISGGDPLLMSNQVLDSLLGRLRGISHIEFVRIGSRVPCFLPQRITPELVKVLRKHRVWLSVHFCHLRELTLEVAQACDLLADGGIPLGCQTVLLKGVNDSEQALKNLFHGLLKLRVRPYYLYQCDPVVGTSHLRTSIQSGLDLISKLRSHTTGYAIPTYVIDAPGGGGKVPIQPETLIGYENGKAIVKNWQDKSFTYLDPVD